jgi:uncharacterized protein (TIGR00369 family)
MFRAVTSERSRWDAVADGSVPIPVNDHLGFRFEDAADPRDRVTISWKVPPESCNSTGNVQGGMLAAFADSLLGAAASAHLPDDQFPALAEMKISIFRPASAGSELTGEGYLVKSGPRVLFAEAEIKDSEGRLIARATGTEIPAQA